MSLWEWMRNLFLYLILLPSAVSCYLPMKHQMKRTPAVTAVLCLAVLLPFSLIAAYVQMRFHLSCNSLLLPAIPVFFLLYFRTLKIDLPRALAVFVGVCAVESFPVHLSNAFHAYLYPQDWSGESMELVLMQMALSSLMLVLACLVRRHYVWVIDHLDFPKIWYSSMAISGTFLAFNVFAALGFLAEDSTERIFRLFPLLEICALALLVCVYVLFYQSARRILERARMERRAQLLEMQSRQYRALQEHMKQTACLRHDFRHSLRLLSSMAECGDLEGIGAYLAQYENVLSEGTPIDFCTNVTMNALFRYYHETAISAGIKTAWRIELPDPLAVSELDLASLFGNIIENGIQGCQTLPEEKRYFNLTIEKRCGNSLYVVATNSFDGHIRKGKTGYRSTKHSGAGLGLVAIAAVVEKYDGLLQVSNSSSEFFMDVMIQTGG